jgi:hypothetical protein
MQHKSDFKKNRNCTSKMIFATYGVEHCDYEILEQVEDDMSKEREAYYIRNHNCVNKYIPDRTRKEYKEEYDGAHKDKKKEYGKEYNKKIGNKLRRIRKAKARVIAELKKIFLQNNSRHIIDA